MLLTNVVITRESHCDKNLKIMNIYVERVTLLQETRGFFIEATF